MDIREWKVGDLFVRKDVDNRFFDCNVVIIKGIRYVKGARVINGTPEGIKVYKVKRINIEDKTIRTECGWTMAEDICERIMTQYAEREKISLQKKE